MKVFLSGGKDKEYLIDSLMAEGVIVVPKSNEPIKMPSTEVEAIILDCNCTSEDNHTTGTNLPSNSIPVLGIAAETSCQCEACGWLCDDLLLPPFTAKELHLRLKRLIEKTRNKFLQGGGLKVDLDTGRAWCIQNNFENREVLELKLTRLEFSLLVCLLRNQSRIVNYDQLLTDVWGCDWDNGNYGMVKAVIRRLRRKIKKCPNVTITSVWGRGYQLQKPSFNTRSTPHG